MLLRRTTPLAIAVAALACEPSVPFNTANNPTKIDYAAFDPTGSPPDIPLPNDLALLPQAIASQPPAQAELLTLWGGLDCINVDSTGKGTCHGSSSTTCAVKTQLSDCASVPAQVGFPNDQEVDVTIDFVSVAIDANTGAQTRSAPTIDTTSINGSNLLVLSLSLSGAGASAVAYDAPKSTDYVINGDHGTLTIRKSPDPTTGSRRWPANSEIVVAVRGGASGVKVTGGAAGGLQPQAAMFLLEQDKDLSLPENQSLLPGATRGEKAATGQQLETLRKKYQLPFAAVDGAGVFTHREIATMGTFLIADTAKRTHVETDSTLTAGLPVPFPSDFMTDATGHLSAQAQPAFGPLGPALATLDGFSTTAMILSQTSAPVRASTVAGGVFIYELQPTATPPFRRLLEIGEALAGAKPPEYAAEPSALTGALTGGTCAAKPTDPCVATALGLQPAVPAALPVAPFLATMPPLKEGTTYVVLVTDQVQDVTGAPLVRSTLGELLLLDPTISIASGGKSTVAGVSDAQAVALDQMRQAINGAAQVLQAEKPALTRDHVVMGYTFKTQTMKTTAVKLTALPYGTPSTGTNSTLNPVGTPTVFCGGCGGNNHIDDAFKAYGVDTAVVPFNHIGSIVEAKIVTFNALSDATGAFIDLTNPANVPATEVITALISLPQPTCGAPACTVPLVIYRHGINDGRGDMLTVANTFNNMGIAVAAIDAVKQGERSFCMKDSECAAGTCVPIASMAGQGDAPGPTPGKCMSGTTPTDFARIPVLCKTSSCSGATFTEARPIASGNFVISGNLFRTRDSFRQDLIDESQLIRVLSPNPACDKTKPPTDANTCASPVLTPLVGSTGILQIDPSQIWWASQSLGSMSGTVDVAANPRITKAAFSVGGGTAVDVFTNSPSFAGQVAGLLAGLKITPGTPGYLQFVNVAKWILDSSDPLNFAVNLSGTLLTWPSPLNSIAVPTARKVLAQISNCDLTVPNPFNAELDSVSGLGPVSPTTSTLQLFTHVNTTTGVGDYSSIGQTSCAVTVTTPAGPVTAPVPEAHSGGGAVPHGLITDWGCLSSGGTTCTVDANLHTLTGTAQSDMANFLANDTLPPPSENAP